MLQLQGTHFEHQDYEIQIISLFVKSAFGFFFYQLTSYFFHCQFPLPKPAEHTVVPGLNLRVFLPCSSALPHQDGGRHNK